MTVIARRVISSPVRSAADTWAAIADLLAPASANNARDELSGVAGIASSLIASEAMKEAPIVLWGSGPRVRIYCLYGEDAVSGEDASESALPFCPTDGDWHMSLPCPTEDLQWVQAALTRRSVRVSARDLAEAVPDKGRDATQANTVASKEAFFRR
ncbi:MAG: hypothetical protein HYX78_01845 [Armatimonadetes bacterium]|nr:hypothetical protein [Armatimonadota bacterium]